MDYGFELDEACALINLTVVDLDITNEPAEIKDIGIICGVLTVNEEVELVIKFFDELRQYTRAEFLKTLKVLKD